MGNPSFRASIPALKAEGAQVETIEGLANGQLHPLQEELHQTRRGAVRLLHAGLDHAVKSAAGQEAGRAGTDEEIKIALKDTYCRCTGYVSVMNAIKPANGQRSNSCIDSNTETSALNVVGSQAARRRRGESDRRGEVRR